MNKRASAALALLAASLVLAGPAQAAKRRSGFAVGEITVVFRDQSRKRTLATEIRYPAVGNPTRTDVREARPDNADGPFPLIVFAHGFDSSPDIYASLLDAWGRAGYVVAAPVFPYTNAAAPGGPNEADLINQPRDVSFVITSVLARSQAKWGILSGLVSSRQVAVSGQSDGGSTALAAAYNSNFVDHRIGAAMILSGAEIPGVGGYDFRTPSPPLLAEQGTADSSIAPASTYRYFDIAPRPKFLLSLLGAGHLPPYSSEQPQLDIVERETIAFLDRYLKRRSGAAGRMWKVGDVAGVSRLTR